MLSKNVFTENIYFIPKSVFRVSEIQVRTPRSGIRGRVFFAVMFRC
jgi:hypothetical protein